MFYPTNSPPIFYIDFKLVFLGDLTLLPCMNCRSYRISKLRSVHILIKIEWFFLLFDLSTDANAKYKSRDVERAVAEEAVSAADLHVNPTLRKEIRSFSFCSYPIYKLAFYEGDWSILYIIYFTKTIWLFSHSFISLRQPHCNLFFVQKLSKFLHIHNMIRLTSFQIKEGLENCQLKLHLSVWVSHVFWVYHTLT